MTLEKKKPNVARAIKRYGELVELKRSGKNEFEEDAGETDVCSLNGYLYSRDTIVSVAYNTSGKAKRLSEERLLVLHDDVSALVAEGDYFTRDAIKYRVVDVRSTQGLYREFTLERMV